MLFSILIGYFLGSISPSYILGRLLKNVDIREVGEKNAGTTNTYKVLGLGPAIITAIYDLLKGLLAMFMAFLIGASDLVIYLAGIAAIIGHIFPFYLGFRGGQGVATATGLLIFFLINLFRNHALPWESLGFMLMIVLFVLFITRQKDFLALIIMPYLLVLIFRNFDFNLLTIFTGIVILHIFAVNIYEANKKKIFQFKSKTLEAALVWRTLLRPLAIIFPILLFLVDKNIVLWILAVLAGILLILDLVRLLSGKINLFFFKRASFVFKKREEKRFSSMTLFLLSSLITILFFPRDIAVITLSFLIFGDVFAKFFGIEYGKTRIFDKSLEGSMAHLMACLLVGYLFWPYVGLSSLLIISGAFIATLAELLPLGINDNFIVPLASAVGMLLIGKII